MYAYRLSLRQVIVERGLVAAETLARAVVVQEESGERLDAVLTRLGLVSEQALAETLAEAAGLRLVQHGTYGDGNGEYNYLDAPDLKCIVELLESYR